MSYADVAGHSSMIFDRTRNAAYAAAIRHYVTPDSVVLDAGAGLGVLGLMAAAAGARTVYLVEPESVVKGALEVARRNGFGDRVVALQGRIEDVELPERVDLITSVFTGNLLYSEDLLPSLFRARDRWLKPGGRLIPDIGELVVAPVCAPRLHEETLGIWSEPHFGIDYAALRHFAANTICYERRSAFLPELISEPRTLISSDFMSATQTTCDARTTFQISTDSICSGVLAWIRIRLGNQWLSTGPMDPSVHWTPQLLLVDPELPFVAGENVDFHLQRPAYGDWTWHLQAAAGKRRQSTFMSHAHSIQDLKKLAPTYASHLNDRGRAAHDLLSRMNGESTNEQLAAYLTGAYPRQFPDESEALAFVRGFGRKYSV